MAISDQEWNNILKYYGNSTHATSSPVIPYCAFTTVDEDGSPRAAPYTSLILGNSCQGVYFDELSRKTSLNIKRNNRVCILIVKNNKWFWIKTVMLGRFDHPPGIRLMGTVGKRREATRAEIDVFKKPLKSLKFFKGYEPTWGFMRYVRQIYFDSYEPVSCRTMKELQTI